MISAWSVRRPDKPLPLFHHNSLTFVAYLSRLRVEKAKILLQDKNLRITEICYEVGFQSLTHFNRIFRKLVGSSPTEYRSWVSEPAGVHGDGAVPS
jgi:AraC-like DNA-binding protein